LKLFAGNNEMNAENTGLSAISNSRSYLGYYTRKRTLLMFLLKASFYSTLPTYTRFHRQINNNYLRLLP